MRKLLSIFLLLVGINSFSQRITYDTLIGGWNAKVTRNLNQGADSVEMIVSILGLGEVGTDSTLNRRYLAHYWLTQGWDGGIPLGNGTHYPIYVTIQNPNANGYSHPSFINGPINAIFTSFPLVKKNGAHTIFLSQGGEIMGTYMTQEPSLGDYSYIKRFKSAVNLCGKAPTIVTGVTPSHPYRYGHWAKIGNNKVLVIQQYNDGTGTNYRIPTNVNDSIPGNAFFIWSYFGSGNHGNFNDMCNPSLTNYTASNTTNFRVTRGSQPSIFIGGGQNIWQWMIRQGDTSVTGGNRPPISNAGNDQTITLPAISVSLSGSGTGVGGATITSYQWTLIDPPSGGSFSNSTIANPTFTVSGGSGTYLLRFVVTDNNGMTGEDYMSVTVNATPQPQPPVVDAGQGPTITQPASSLTLTGTASTPQGTITSIVWSKKTQGSYAISSPNNLTTTVTGLTLGQHELYLTATNSDGLLAKDSVVITVLPQSSTTNTAINVALVGTQTQQANTINDPAWNVWNINTTTATTNLNSQAFFYETGQQSVITATLSHNTNISDNGTSYTNTITAAPNIVGRYALFSNTASRTLTFNNLTQGKAYALKLYSTRNTTANTAGTTFTVNGVSKPIMSAQNLDSVIVFDYIEPKMGSFTVTMTRFYSNNGTYLNGFVLTELGSEGGNVLPQPFAGPDRTLRLPSNSIAITGSGTDLDGTIASYSWTKLSGPTATLTNTNQATFNASNLVRGVYVFQLTVTDDDGGQSQDQMMLQVFSQRNEAPIARAGNDTTVRGPSVTLFGSDSDPDGIITSRKWLQIAGPSVADIQYSTTNTPVIDNMLLAGIYQFEYTVIDDSTFNNTGKDTITIDVTTTIVIDCRANAGGNIVTDVSQAVLDGRASIGSNLTYKWTRITAVDFKFKAVIKNSDSAVAQVQILPYRDGGYDFELTVDNGVGCISRDTVNVFRTFGPAPPQSPDGIAGWHRATAADTTDINSRNGIGFARIGDVIISGARSNLSSIGYLNIATNPTGTLSAGPGTKILIKGGKYNVITLKFPQDSVKGAPGNPVIITNYDGQVRANYFTMEDGVNIKITGEYVPNVSGSINFQGHKGGNYAYSRGKYGFWFDNEWTSLASVGLKLDGYFTDSVEVCYVEVGNGNFAGMQIKQDGRQKEFNAVYLHDNYIHDIHGEGIYIGSTASSYRHGENGWLIENNRWVNAGNEIIQFNNAGDDNIVRNNVFINSATNWKSSFNLYQDNGWQGTYRNGRNKFMNNIMVGTGHQSWNFYSSQHESQVPNGDSIIVKKNLYWQGRGRNAIVLNYDNAVPGIHTFIDSNYFGGYDFRGDELYSASNINSINSNNMINYFGSVGPDIKMRHTFYDNTKPTLNNGEGAIDIANSTQESVTPPQFVDGGFPRNFDFNYYSEWADSIFYTWRDENVTSETNVQYKTPVYFSKGDYVLWLSKTYISKRDTNHAHMPKGVTDEYWELVTWTSGGQTYTYPPDDYRLSATDKYKLLGMGLTDDPPAQPAPNVPPTITVTPNTIIRLPVNTILLEAQGRDVDGTISSYVWEKLVGPDSYVILDPGSGTTVVGLLTEGTYTFRVTATDNQGATVQASVNVTVLPPIFPTPNPPRKFFRVN